MAAGEADRDERMVGDINLFLAPWENDDEQDDDQPCQPKPSELKYVVGEVDIMIADVSDRGKGIGKAAVSTFLWFIKQNVRGILAEYAQSIEGKDLTMNELVVRIKATNEGSRALFKGLGFEQRGNVNYFGEIEMVLQNFAGNGAVKDVEGYRELQFDRAKLRK